jgi:hypothetical protein
MKDFRRNLPLLLLIATVTVVLNGTELLLHYWFSMDPWLLRSVVAIDDYALLVCVLLWTVNHALVFAKSTAHEYAKIRGKRKKNASASKRGKKAGNGN